MLVDKYVINKAHFFLISVFFVLISLYNITKIHPFIIKINHSKYKYFEGGFWDNVNKISKIQLTKKTKLCNLF
jgi:hypothetical protein